MACSSERMCHGLSVSEWPNLLNPRQVENFEKACDELCQNANLRLPGQHGKVNCITMCIKGMADEVKPQVSYKLNRNAASSHPSPSSISFFAFPVQLGIRDWIRLYDGEQPVKQAKKAPKPRWKKKVEPSKWQRASGVRRVAHDTC
jgi:hypothetical protein